MTDLKKILITGGAGFVGINLVDYLMKTQRYKITILDNLSTGNYQLLHDIVIKHGLDMEERLSSSPGKVCFLRMDILEKENIPKVLKGQDYVVHLAAQTGVIPSLKTPFHDASVNITGTLNMLSASVEHKIRKFIFASSAAPLGEQIPPLDETKVPRPLSPYGASKLAAEAYCSAFYGSYGLNSVILRFSNLYGTNSFHKGSVIALFIKKLLKKEPLIIYGDGDQTRDFLYVGDIVRVIDKILESDDSAVNGELFQLGTGVETSVNRLLRYLSDVTGINPDIIYEPARKGEIKRNFTSTDKITRILGYEPQFDLKKGLEQTWNWFKSRAQPHVELKR